MNNIKELKTRIVDILGMIFFMSLILFFIILLEDIVFGIREYYSVKLVFLYSGIIMITSGFLLFFIVLKFESWYNAWIK